MTQIKEFSQNTKEQILLYVYGLKHPETGGYFYIGKGEGDRVFAHIKEAEVGKKDTPKLNTIRKILNDGLYPEIDIIRHNLDEERALLLEASLIDILSLERLTNAVKGHGSNEFGIMSAQDLNNAYTREQADINFPAMIIKINQNFTYRMTEERLYEVTRNSWVVGEKRNRATHAISVANGVIREVYKIHKWQPATDGVWGENGSKTGRWEFVGEPDPEKQNLKGCTVDHLQSQGAQNPIRYVNLGEKPNDPSPAQNHTLPIEQKPDANSFKTRLLEKKEASIVIHYQDGSVETKKWKANRFTETSDVCGNLRSRPEFRAGEWQRRNISKICVYV